MLQAHSLLWHYLWAGPNALLLLLFGLLLSNGVGRRFPAFLAFCLLGSLSQLAVYTADVLPTVTPETFWRVDWAGLLIEGPVKFILVGEIFAHVFGTYASVAKLGKTLIRIVGVALVLAAALAAAYAPKNGSFGIVAGAHLLDQTIYFVETGLLLFIFALSSYFRLSLERPLFGIALGLSLSACVHLATWALMANGSFGNPARYALDFLNMATYHVCVLIWFYYLLVPGRVATKSIVSVPEHSLEVWNQELERLLHQ